jgi:hypothetical protein
MIQGFSGGLLRNTELFYLLDLPTFQRDFAQFKTLDHATGPAITFTRASDATYFDADGVLQTASNNVPRFDHDPATGASRGLLIEEARTNLLERSAQLDNAYWSKSEASISANVVATTAPDGSSNADKLVETNAAGTHFASITPTLNNATNYTISVFAKAAERDRLFVSLATGGGASTSAFQASVQAIFDLTDGSVVSTVGTPTTFVQNIGNGWYRVGLSKVTTQEAITSLRFLLIESGTTTNYTGDGTSGLYLWGAQLEAGAFPTSYIPTTTAAATRAADSAVVTPISSFYNQNEGTLFAEASYAAVGSATSSSNRVSLHVDDTTSNNRYLVYNLGTNGAGGGAIIVSGATQANLSIGSTEVPANTPVRLALSYKTDDVIAAKNGTLSSADTSASLPSVTHFRIGRTHAPTGAANINGHIHKLAYWPKRLTNTLLEQLTT